MECEMMKVKNTPPKWFKKVRRMYMPLSITEAVDQVIMYYVLNSSSCDKRMRVLKRNGKWVAVPVWDRKRVMFIGESFENVRDQVLERGLSLFPRGAHYE